jgi:hypothetical protein
MVKDIMEMLDEQNYPDIDTEGMPPIGSHGNSSRSPLRHT